MNAFKIEVIRRKMILTITTMMTMTMTASKMRTTIITLMMIMAINNIEKDY